MSSGISRTQLNLATTLPPPSRNLRQKLARLLNRIFSRKRRGRTVKPVELENDEPERDESNAVAKKLALAYRLIAMIETGKYSMRTHLAEALGLDQSNVVKTLNLLNLSPKIQKIIIENKMPDGITLERLYGNVPEDWEEQERELLS